MIKSQATGNPMDPEGLVTHGKPREKDSDIVDVDPNREIKLPGDNKNQPRQERLPGKDERLPGKNNENP